MKTMELTGLVGPAKTTWSVSAPMASLRLNQPISFWLARPATSMSSVEPTWPGPVTVKPRLVSIVAA